MVGQAVQSGTGQEVVGEDFAPLLKGAVTGDDQGSLFIALGNDLVEITVQPEA